MPTSAARHGAWLWRLTGAFAFRVAAQPLAGATGWAWLPPFEAWHSGALPYPALVVTQLVLLAWMGRTAARVTASRDRPAPARGRWLAAAAAAYGATMLFRLTAGFTWARGHWWLDAPWPTVFHLVLVTYLAVYAHHLRHATSRAA